MGRGSEGARECVARPGGPGGAAPQVAGTGQHTGYIAGVGPIRKIGRENRINKSAISISKPGKNVRSQLAEMQRKMYKIVPVERQGCSKGMIIKNRCKPLKNGLQRSFLAPPAGFEPVTCRLGVRMARVVHVTPCKPVSLQSIGFTGFFGFRCYLF